MRVARGHRWRRAAAVLEALAVNSPERLDIKSALAGALWGIAGRREEAMSLARDLLATLPHALKANWILSQAAGEAANLARERVAALDPLDEYPAIWFGPPAN